MKCDKCGHRITPFHRRDGRPTKLIRQLRRRGFSYREIASLAGVSVGTVQLALGYKRQSRSETTK